MHIVLVARWVLICRKHNIFFWEQNEFFYMETAVGIWRLTPGRETPYRLEHINLTVTPDNRTTFHKQPRLFLSLQDIFFYVKRHDEGLNLEWKGSQYQAKGIAL